MLRLTLAAVIVLSGIVAGCVIFTGGTDGFTVSEAGPANSGGSCTTSANCNGGQMCCWVLDGALPTTSCLPSCTPSFEACGVASDCGDGGVCCSQSCTLDAGVITSATVTTCGAIPFCTQ
jgi:hypothetical protein